MSQIVINQHTALGRVQGLRESGIRQFLGLRYAQPPIGALRFQPPQPHTPGAELIDATRYGNRHLQVGWPEEVLAGLEWQGEESEDCLFLNVFTPDSETDEPRPVLVWIHGGAFMCGSGNDYDASKFVRDYDVVVVTINYRIGVFGFLNLETLGNAHAGSANLGIQDQIAALRWVQANIESFGGDASNVTIWGESAGGASVLALLGAPAAEGLFHKGMAFSGAETLAPPTDQMSMLKAVLATDSDAECLARMQAMSAFELSELQQASAIYVGPSVDGHVITRPACEAIEDGAAASIPILTGATRDEGTILAPSFAATEELGSMVLLGLSASIGRDDGATYRAFLDEEVADGSIVDKVSRAWFDTFRSSALRVAATATLMGAGGWVYNFEVETEHELGIAHFADVPFTFNWLEEGNPGLFVHQPTERNRELAANWSRAVATFARTGSPNSAGLPEWPTYGPKDYDCLRLADEPGVVSNPDGLSMLKIYRVPEA